VCFPSYERIAEKAECARSTVAEALRVLEWAGVLTWQQRITRGPRAVHRSVWPRGLALAGDQNVILRSPYFGLGNRTLRNRRLSPHRICHGDVLLRLANETA
jgi:hypothetical protein